MTDIVIVDLVSIEKQLKDSGVNSVRSIERELAKYVREILSDIRPKGMVVHLNKESNLPTTALLIDSLGLNCEYFSSPLESISKAISNARHLAENGQGVVLGGVGVTPSSIVSDNISYHCYGTSLKEDLVTPNSIKAQTGLEPKQIADLVALVGDSNFSIREKISVNDAVKALIQHRTIEEVVNNHGLVQRTLDKILVANRDAILKDKARINNITSGHSEFSYKAIGRRSINQKNLYELYIKNEYFEWLPQALQDEHMPKCNFGSSITATTIIETESDADQLVIKLLNSKGCGVCLTDAGLAVSTRNGHSAFIPTKGSGNSNALQRVIHKILESEDIKKTCFEAKSLYRYGLDKEIDVKGIVCDPTILAFVINTQNKEKTLSQLCESNLELKVRDIKDGAMYSANDIESNAGLCGEIADATHRVSKSLYKTAMNDGFSIKPFNEIDLPLIKVLAKMEHNGVLIDTDFARNLINKTTAEIEALSKQLNEIAGLNINVNDHKQVGILLFEKLGLPCTASSVKQRYDTSKEALQAVSHLSPAPEIIIKIRSLQSLSGTSINGVISSTGKDGRVRTTLMQNAATTTRLTSRDPSLHGLPSKGESEKARAAVIAEENFQLMSYDLSQIELRILASVSMDEGLIRAFNSGCDVHKMTAAEVFEVNIKDVTDDQRKAAKAINFGIIYGQTPFGLSKKLGVTEKVAQDFINRYFTKYPKVRTYVINTIAFARKNGYIITPTGRKIVTPDMRSKTPTISSSAERTAQNAPMQAGAADIVKVAMLDVSNQFDKLKLQSKLILQVHDELVVEVHNDEVEIVARLVKSALEHAYAFNVPLLAEGTIGPNLSAEYSREITITSPQKNIMAGHK